jgi:hypothetical protein
MDCAKDMNLMSERSPVYQAQALIDEIKRLRSQIAMYLKSGIADSQAQQLLEQAEVLLRKAQLESK